MEHSWLMPLQSKPACPLCRAPVEKGDLVEPQQPAEPPDDINNSASQGSAAASAKVVALIQARRKTKRKVLSLEGARAATAVQASTALQCLALHVGCAGLGDTLFSQSGL